MLGHKLEDLVSLVKSYGYRKGILLQLNNLDVTEVHQEAELKQLFNLLRDYPQTAGVSWLFVGDILLRKFIAQQVDRLYDIISYEVNIGALKQSEFYQLIERRIEFYRINLKATLSIDMDVLQYLFQITKGRVALHFWSISTTHCNVICWRSIGNTD